jgi:hypothetical protein
MLDSMLINLTSTLFLILALNLMKAHQEEH